MEQVESIVPWDGTIGYPSIYSGGERANEAMLVERSEALLLPYSIVVSTNNNAWFSLDTYQENPVSQPQDYAAMGSRYGACEKENEYQADSRSHRGLMSESDKSLRLGTEPILPSFIDDYSVHSSVLNWSAPVTEEASVSTTSRRSVARKEPETESAASSVNLELLRAKLNEIIDNHNHISDEIGTIATSVGFGDWRDE